MGSFVAETLKSVGRNMRTKEVDEEHVEAHVYWLGDGDKLEADPCVDDVCERERCVPVGGQSPGRAKRGSKEGEYPPIIRVYT